MSQQGVAILGVFVADLAFRASRLPAIGETMIGSGFAVGPGGKGSLTPWPSSRASPAYHWFTHVNEELLDSTAELCTSPPLRSAPCQP